MVDTVTVPNAIPAAAAGVNREWNRHGGLWVLPRRPRHPVNLQVGRRQGQPGVIWMRMPSWRMASRGRRIGYLLTDATAYKIWPRRAVTVTLKGRDRGQRSDRDGRPLTRRIRTAHAILKAAGRYRDVNHALPHASSPRRGTGYREGRRLTAQPCARHHRDGEQPRPTWSMLTPLLIYSARNIPQPPALPQLNCPHYRALKYTAKER